MKRLLTGALALILSIAASATTLNPIQLLNPAGSSAGQAIVSTGASTTPAWSNVAATALAAQAANTVVANGTGSSASPTAYAMPSCSGNTSALTWLSGTGFGCNSGINAATLGGATFASPGAIGLTTPAAGKFTTLQATSTITPSSTAGIVGTATNDNANAGSVGEYVTNSTSGTSLATNTSANCTSVSLTAGDWDVSGSVQYNPAGSTNMSGLNSGISTTSATLGALGTSNAIGATLTTGIGQIQSTPVVRISLSGTTTVFLIGNASFGTSTMTCNGFIRGRRVR
jgi:hypothetical protein